MKVSYAVLLLAGFLGWPLHGTAQSTRLRLSGFNGNLGNTVVTDFDAGYRDSRNATRIRVDVRNPQPDIERATAVYIRADQATLGSGKPVGDLLWRRDDFPDTWVPLTTGDELVYSQELEGFGEIWSQLLWFRMLLNWEDAPSTYETTLTFTLVVSAP